MTAKTTTFEFPPEAAGSWYEGVLEAAADGAFDPPASVVNWAKSLGVTVRAGNSAAAEHVHRFPSNWLNAAVARQAQMLSARSASTPITDAMVEAGASELVALQDAQRLVSLRRDLAERLASRVRDLAGGVLTEPSIMPALQAAHEEVLAAVRELGPDVPMDPTAALDASPAAQSAYRRLTALEARFLALHRAVDSLRANPFIRIPCRDGSGLFGDTPVGPGTSKAPTTAAVINRPGPDGLARLVWLAGPGKGWLPTIAEQDAAVDRWSIAASAGAKSSSLATEAALSAS